MKTLGPIVCTLALLAFFGLNYAAVAAADDQQAITNVEHKLAAATTAEEALKYYDPSDQVTLFDMSGPPREYAGHKAVSADLAKGFTGLKDIKVNFVELKVVTDGKLGFASSVQHFTATGPDGKPVEITFRQTDVLHKVKGQWKILHQHISVPVDLKTGKADMASKMQQ
jgi:ketosteroid isomerase-like protein